MGLDQWLWVDATLASRKARRVFNVYDTAVREAFRVEASGTAPMIGFLGAAAVAKPAAATDIGTVLSDLGLRVAGTAYPITTSGAVQFTGGVTISTQALTITDVDIVLSTSTGTRIGTVTDQKLSFYNSVPVVKQTGCVSLDEGYVAGTLESEAEIIDAFNTTNA